MSLASAATDWQLMILLLQLIVDHDSWSRYPDFDPGLKARIIEAAKAEGVAEALAHQLANRDAVTANNPDYSELLQILRHSTLRNMAYVSQAVKLARTLNGVGVIPIFLKGGAYLLSHYQDKLGYRLQGDIDILVSPEEIHTTCEALRFTGYHFVDIDAVPQASTDRDLSTREADSISRHHHHLLPLMKEGEPAAVEVHRHHLPRRFQDQNPVRELIDDAQTVEYRGAQFKVPGAEHQLIHLILGKLVHDGQLARRRLPVRDIVDYVGIRGERCDDLDEALISARCRGLDRWLDDTLQTLLSVDPLSSAVEPLRDYRLRLIRARYSYRGADMLFDAYGRAAHLGASLIHNPSKLNGFLRRRFRAS